VQQARYGTEPTTASEDTMLALLKRAARDAIDLVQNEFALARAEGRDTVATLKRTIAVMLIAATLLLAGGLAIVAGIVLLLALWIPAWVAAVGLGAVLFGAGVIVFVHAAKDAAGREFDLPRTRDSVTQDLAVLKRDTGRPA
jgi:hypothetical protein